MKYSCISKSDPDLEKIKQTCQSIVGSKINIGFTIILRDNEKYNGEIKNCNIIGDCMENILLPFLKKNIPTFVNGPKQSSPDFFNNIEYEYELKCFKKNPGFDISNFNSYISQLNENLERKLYKTYYLIFEYKFEKNTIVMVNFKLCKIWEIINYTGKYPISIQNKKGIWYNIRPCRYKCMNDRYKTPLLFIKQICKAILITPNKLEGKKKIINNIYTQFYKIQFNKILQQI